MKPQILNIRDTTKSPVIKLYRDNRPQLELFRQKLAIDTGGNRLYSSAKLKLYTYKMIFAGLAACFFFLAGSLWIHAVPHATGLFSVSQSILVKNMIGAMCALFGLTCFSVSFFMRTDRDVAARLKRKAHKKLARHYAKRKIELGLTKLFHFGASQMTAKALKQAYCDAWGVIQDHHGEMLQIFDHIAQSSGLTTRAREHLYNQALCELNRKLHNVVQLFRTEV